MSFFPTKMQVIYGNGIDTAAVQLEQRKKSWPNYTLKALLFACAMLYSAYMNLSSSTSVAIRYCLWLILWSSSSSMEYST